MHYDKKTAVAVGKFDGVHQGHKKLLIKASELAKEAGFVSVGFIISQDKSGGLLTVSQRDSIIKSLGIDICHVQNLTEEFMQMSAEEFVQDVLKNQLNCAHVVVGYNFRFAKGRSADAQVLKDICQKNGIGCTIIDKVTCLAKDGTAVTASSTNIKSALMSGDVKTAALILGRAYSLSGEVMHGREIGRTLDFPTANIAADASLVLPKNGVYATKTFLDGAIYPSVTNIGDNPTVTDSGNITVETNIIGFDRCIYGKKIEIEFVDRIRDEIKFASLEELKNQIKKDIEIALLAK